MSRTAAFLGGLAAIELIGWATTDRSWAAAGMALAVFLLTVWFFFRIERM